MNDNNIHATISEIVLKARSGTVFTTADFATIACCNTVRQSLFRLVKEGYLRRLFPGCFDKPEYSRLLKKYVMPDPAKVAEALARCFHWTISPAGNAALNLLGLDTQVPARNVYVSTGPYRKYQWSNTTIEFRHGASKDLFGLSFISRLVVQALKAIDRNHVGIREIYLLSTHLSVSDKRKLLKECRGCTDWVYSCIRRICTESQESLSAEYAKWCEWAREQGDLD